jgi:hypothetical protein
MNIADLDKTKIVSIQSFWRKTGIAGATVRLDSGELHSFGTVDPKEADEFLRISSDIMDFICSKE